MISTADRATLLSSLLVGLVGPAFSIDGSDLSRAAARANQGLPRMVANDLRQDRVYVTRMTLVYQYTHLSLDSGQLRRMRLEETQPAFILPQLCSASDTGRLLREGVRFRYVYLGRDGSVGGDLVLSMSNCGDRQ